MRIETCQFDATVPVVFVESGDKGPLVRALKERGHGFAVYGEVPTPLIVFDSRCERKSWWTQDHTLAVIAHELAHIHNNSDDEVRADLGGAQILREAGFYAAASLLQGRQKG